jgi:predicted ferric reductase
MPPAVPVENEYESSINIQFLLTIMIAMIVGLLAAILVLPTWLPNLASSLTGSDPKVFWYLSRGSAFVSLSILWLSMALGLGITNKMARLWPGAPAAFAIHEYVSLLGLVFAAFHALILLGDHYINFTVAQILMPFSTLSYRPTWTGIGQLSFYLWLIVALSFYVRSRIGQKTWRSIHYLSFALFIMGLAHGLFAGTDSTASWAHWYYWISAGSLLFLLVYRIINTITEKLTRQAARRVVPAARPAPAPGPSPKPVGLPVSTTPQNK